MSISVLNFATLNVTRTTVLGRISSGVLAVIISLVSTNFPYSFFFFFFKLRCDFP